MVNLNFEILYSKCHITKEVHSVLQGLTTPRTLKQFETSVLQAIESDKMFFVISNLLIANCILRD